MKQSNSTVSYMPGTQAGHDIPETGQINWHSVPPTPIVVQGPAAKARFPWGAVIIAGGLVWAASMVVNNNQPKTPQERPAPTQVQSTRVVAQSPPAVRVERALPVVVPRAEAVGNNEMVDAGWLDNPANIGKWVAMRIPDEGSVWVHYQGSVLSGRLPATAKRWDWYHVGDHDWVYMAPAGTTTLGWIDP